MQMDVHKTLYCFYITKRFPMKARAPFASILKSFWSGALGYTNLTKRCTFCHLLQLLLNWRIKVVATVNSTHVSLKWTWTINNYVYGSLICLCWLNRTHSWTLLPKLFSALRLSEMLLLFINCLISIFASTIYQCFFKVFKRVSWWSFRVSAQFSLLCLILINHIHKNESFRPDTLNCLNTTFAFGKQTKENFINRSSPKRTRHTLRSTAISNSSAGSAVRTKTGPRKVGDVVTTHGPWTNLGPLSRGYRL